MVHQPHCFHCCPILHIILQSYATHRVSIIMLLFLMKSLCGTMSPVTHRGTCYFFLCSVSPDLPNQNLHGFNGMDDFYIKPWCRFQPYLMGLLLGYILFKLRGKTIHIPQVTNCIQLMRNRITGYPNIHSSLEYFCIQGLNVFLWLLSVAMGMFLTFITYPMRTSQNFTWFESTMYNTLSKIGWSLALGWVIFSCCKGIQSN